MILIAVSFHRNEGRLRAGGSAQKVFGTTPFQSKEKAPFDKDTALQKGHFHSFAVKGRGPDPQYPPSCAPA